MERTIDAVREHTACVRELTGDIRVIATSALRRADNADLFAGRIFDVTGVPLEIISGEEEARRSFLGAVSGIESGGATRLGVIDTGGGSTEYAAGTRRAAQHIVSCEIGAVRLTEAVAQLAGGSSKVPDSDIARARSLARTALLPITGVPPVDRLLFVGGSATAAIAVMRGDRAPFAYAELTRAALRSLVERLRGLDLHARKAIPGMNPQRADILLAGLLIVEQVFELLAHERALVSSNDLLLGTLLQ